MNWDAIGAVGDAAGGIGVIVSLIYLALQTRSNTTAVQAASFHQINSSFAEISLAICLDASLTMLITKALAGEAELSPEEEARFSFFALSFFRRAESMFFQSDQGTLQKESWLGLESTLDAILSSQNGRSWWNVTRERFNPRFQLYIRERLLS